MAMGKKQKKINAIASIELSNHITSPFLMDKDLLYMLIKQPGIIKLLTHTD